MPRQILMEDDNELFKLMLNRNKVEHVTKYPASQVDSNLEVKVGRLLTMNGVYWAHKPVAIREWNGKKVVDISKRINVRKGYYLRKLWRDMAGVAVTGVRLGDSSIKKLQIVRGNTEFIVPDIGIYDHVSMETIQEYNKGQYGENLKKTIQNPDIFIDVWPSFWLSSRYYDYRLFNVVYKMLVYKELGLWDEHVKFRGTREPRVIFIVPNVKVTTAEIRDMVEELEEDEHFFFLEDLDEEWVTPIEEY